MMKKVSYDDKYKLLLSTFGLIGLNCLIKVVSFVRELIYSSNFGTSIESDAYCTANIIPNLINTPFFTGMLMFFIPIYLEIYSAKGMKGANSYTSNILAVYTLISSLLMGMLFLLSPNIVQLISNIPNSEIDINLTVELMRISCLSFPITMATWIFIYVSHANNSFAFPQFFSFCNILLSTLGILFYSKKIGIYAVPIFSTLGWIVQLIFQYWFCRNFYSYYRILDIKADYIKRILVLAIPVFISIGAEQINYMVDNMLALSFSARAISVLSYSQKFFNLFNSLIATAIVTVMYPVLSKCYNQGEVYVSTINKSEKLLLEMIVPVTFVCLFMGNELIALAFMRGNFSFEDVKATASVLRMYAIALPFWGLRALYNRVFFVQRDSKTPMVVTLVTIVFNIVLSIFFSQIFGVPGVALATTLACCIACISSRFRLSQVVRGIPTIKVLKTLVQTIIASTGMIIVVLFFHKLIKLTFCLNYLIAFIFGIIVYVVVLFVLRNDDSIFLCLKLKKFLFR